MESRTLLLALLGFGVAGYLAYQLAKGQAAGQGQSETPPAQTETPPVVVDDFGGQPPFGLGNLGNYKVTDLEVIRVADHPVWEGVDTADLTFRRGVAGFYGRGANPPPPGARIIHVLGPGRHPVDYEVRPAVGGRLLVHAGADLWNYADSGNTAARMMPQLLDWIAKPEDA